MIKIKRIIPLILAVCMIFTLCFSLGCSTKKELNSIELDTSNAKIEFSLGEEYRPTGLKVKANYKSGKSEIINTNAVSIDTGDYNPYDKGTYDITVSYTSEGTTAKATYQVKVIDALFGGLGVTLKKGQNNLRTLSKSMQTVDFTYAYSWIEVRKPDENGNIDLDSAPLSRNSYTVKIYRNGDEVTELGALKRGVYQIVASMYDAKEDYTYEGFTFVVVFDDVESIVFKEGKTSQDKGLKETMTPTWKFTVTYNSGDTEVVDKNNPYLTLPRINPNMNLTVGTVKVTYGEPKVLDIAPATSIGEVVVQYSLTGEPKNPDLAILNFGDTDKFDKDTSYTDQTVEYQYKTDATTFNVVFGNKGKIRDDRKASFELPTGIVVDGKTQLSCSQAFQSGDASTATGMYIDFTLDRNCEIYIYARSNSTEARCMYLETENDWAFVEGIDGYLGISDVPTLSSEFNNAQLCSVHAASITGLNKLNPAEFKITFDNSINVFYVLIIFPEEAK